MKRSYSEFIWLRLNCLSIFFTLLRVSIFYTFHVFLIFLTLHIFASSPPSYISFHSFPNLGICLSSSSFLSLSLYLLFHSLYHLFSMSPVSPCPFLIPSFHALFRRSPLSSYPYNLFLYPPFLLSLISHSSSFSLFVSDYLLPLLSR